MSMALSLGWLPACSPHTPRWWVTDVADHAPRNRVRLVVVPVTHGLDAFDGGLPVTQVGV